MESGDVGNSVAFPLVVEPRGIYFLGHFAELIRGECRNKIDEAGVEVSE